MATKPLKEYIHTIPDFPKEGVLFRDITTLVESADGFHQAIDEFARCLDGVDYDLIAGIEARGFLFAAPLSYLHHKPFIPVRKAGKLPRATISKEYALEYGTATLEIHKDAVRPGQRVVLIDDLLATGGTLKAAAEMIEQLGGEVVKILCMIELPALGGRQTLAAYDVDCPVSFDGE